VQQLGVRQHHHILQFAGSRQLQAQVGPDAGRLAG
jgi:hypothetical protein